MVQSQYTSSDIPSSCGENEKEIGVFQNLRQLISVVDDLRDVGLQQYINLPRICVVGTQSAGKSSVLEAIVGLDFLPRGDGVVTRRPLELRLVHTKEKDGEIYATFENDRSKHYKDFSQVRAEIDNLTEKIAGRNKGIVDDPIVLTISGPSCPDLTLVDLPGITRVPLKGSDQTDDIEKLTRDMATRYAEDPRTIILAVIPANQDMSTSDALQLARRVDPLGLRTLGVITKIDLMDRGTNACRMILGEEIPLRLGYIGVRNRSQHDSATGMSVKQSIEAEGVFFKEHSEYRHLPKTAMGTQSLTDKLTRILFKHIKQFLPEIKAEINTKLRLLQERLRQLGDGVPIERAEKTQLMWTMVNDYCELFCNTIRGKYDKRLILYQSFYQSNLGQSNSSNFNGVGGSSHSNANYSNGNYSNVNAHNTNGGADCISTQNHLHSHYSQAYGHGMAPIQVGGAQIRSIFNELLNSSEDHASITRDMSDADIDEAIHMHEGDSLPGFPSPDTFEYLLLPHLRKVHYPVMDCLEKVGNCLESLAANLADRVFCRFPALSEQVLELTQAILNREKAKTRTILENLVNAETGYLFTNDLVYLSSHGSMLPVGPNSEEQSQNNTSQRQANANANAQYNVTNSTFGGALQNNNANANSSTNKNTDINGNPLTQTNADSSSSRWFGGMSRSTEQIQTQGQSMLHAVQQNVSQMWNGEQAKNSSSSYGFRRRTQYSEQFLAEIRARLDAYFSIIIRNIRDTGPKTIGYFLVRSMQDALQFELYTSFNKAEHFDQLLGEPEHVREEREKIHTQISTLQAASLVIQKDPSIVSLISPAHFDPHFDADLEGAKVGLLAGQSSNKNTPMNSNMNNSNLNNSNGNGFSSQQFLNNPIVNGAGNSNHGNRSPYADHSMNKQNNANQYQSLPAPPMPAKATSTITQKAAAYLQPRSANLLEGFASDKKTTNAGQVPLFAP